jgi:DNA-binding transcriptional regulator YiaG
MTEETAAAKVSVTVDKLKEWEEGTNQPTIRQAQTLAKAYNDLLLYSFARNPS